MNITKTQKISAIFFLIGILLLINNLMANDGNNQKLNTRATIGAANKKIIDMFGFTNCQIRVTWTSEVDVSKSNSNLVQDPGISANRKEEYIFSGENKTLKLKVYIKEEQPFQATIATSLNCDKAGDIWMKEVRLAWPHIKIVINDHEK